MRSGHLREDRLPRPLQYYCKAGQTDDGRHDGIYGCYLSATVTPRRQQFASDFPPWINDLVIVTQLINTSKLVKR